MSPLLLLLSSSCCYRAQPLLLNNSPHKLTSWGFAARHLQSLTPSTGSSSSSKTDDDAAAPQHHQQHHKQQQQLLHHQQQHTLQQQHHLQEHQQQPTSSWLEQLTHCSSSSSRQERLAALSRLTISLHGRAAELAGAGLLQALSAAAAAATTNILPKAAAAAAATAATVAAGVPAGVSMAYFQGTRYQGRNSLTSPGTYWLRQMGLDDSKVTALLVAANAGCFGMQQVSTTFTSYCVRAGFKIAAGEYWRLLTAAFVHGNFLHFGINTFALWNMGRMIEPQLGGGPFLAVYLASAISGNLLGYWMSTSFSVSMGSSSALFGLLGAYLATSFINRHSPYVSRAQVVSVLQTLGINMAVMLFFGGHMDNWAHLGGFAGGAVMGAAVGPRYGRFG